MNRIIGAPRKGEDDKSLTLTLPLDLCEEVEAKSKALDIGFDQLVSTLLRFGLRVQRDHEEALNRLVERMRNTDDPQEKKRLSHELGSELFG
jgi:hypothetical protein